jgi:hypothetical protein
LMVCGEEVVRILFLFFFFLFLRMEFNFFICLLSVSAPSLSRPSNPPLPAAIRRHLLGEEDAA